MSCDFCGSTFDGNQPLQLTIQKSGDDLLLYAKNQSKNILSTSRMLLCLHYDSGTYVLYLRPDSPYQKLTTREIEQGTMILQYRIKTTAKSAQAEAEYVEISGRSVSCNYDL